MQLEQEFHALRSFRDRASKMTRQELQILAESLFLESLQRKQVELPKLPRFTSLELTILDMAESHQMCDGFPMPIAWLERQIGTVAETLRSLERKGAISVVDGAIVVNESIMSETEKSSYEQT